MKITNKALTIVFLYAVGMFASLNGFSERHKLASGFHYENDQNNRPVAVKDKPVTKTISIWERMKMTAPEKSMTSGVSLTSISNDIVSETVKIKTSPMPSPAPSGGGEKSQVLAAVLAFFLGGLGIHRFYLGYTWQGVVQLLTVGGLGIWSLIDFIRILLGTLKPKDGEYK